MKIEIIQYIVYTANCSSISEAAEQLFLHQTTLSSAIKNVEDTIGFEIFERGKKSIVMTEKGRKFVALATELSDTWEKMRQIGKTVNDVNEISLLMHMIAADQHTPDILNSFNSLCPSGKVSIYTAPQNQFNNQMLKGKYNMGIGYTNPSSLEHTQNMFEGKGFEVIVLQTYRTYLYVNKNSKFANREYVEFNELIGEQFALSESGMMEHHNSDYEPVLERPSVFPNIYLVRRAVEEQGINAFYLPCNDDPQDWFNRGTSIKKIRLLKAPPNTVCQNYLVCNRRELRSESEEKMVHCIIDIMG